MSFTDTIPQVASWIVALLVLVPFAFGVSSILTVETQRPLTSRRRDTCLYAMVLLMLGLGCALFILHANHRVR